MPHRRPPRLGSFDYRGRFRYFLTFCTFDRQQIFVNSSLVDGLTALLKLTCRERAFAVLAYVFMPDHLHLLLEGLTEHAQLRPCLTVFRKRTAIMARRQFRVRLWQDGFFERVLRPNDQVEHVIAYILNNPIRKGLVARVRDYPFVFPTDIEIDGSQLVRN